jgi:hypothetical protein
MKNIIVFFVVALTSATIFAGASQHNLLPSDYQNRTALEKQAILWSHLSTSYEDQKKTLPNDKPGFLDLLDLFSTSFLAWSFNWVSDEMITKRNRLIHRHGAAAKVILKPNPECPYSGVFCSGGVGVMRFSLGGVVHDLAKDSFAPGVALKILIDNNPSVNFHAIYSLDGQGPDNWDFFANSFSNVVDDPKDSTLRRLAAKFRDALSSITNAPRSEKELPLEQSAAIYSDGTSIPTENRRTPYKITFEPTKEVREFWAKTIAKLELPAPEKIDFRMVLARIPVGTALYEVIGFDENDKTDRHIGTIALQSPIVASEFGDKTLFFQHQTRMPQGQ